MTMDEFLSLRNYSCSVPTEVVPGKRWRRARLYSDQDKSDPGKWIIQEYVACEDDPNMVTIKNTAPRILTDTETMIRDRLYQ